MKIAKFLKYPNYLIGVLLFTVFFIGCDRENQDKVIYQEKFDYLSPIDSISFNYVLNLPKERNEEIYPDNRYGQNIHLDSNGCFIYTNINSLNELHTFNFCTNEHTFSETICNYRIDAFKIDSSRIYLLYNDTFYIKDYNLNTLDSFKFSSPTFNQKNRIDFTIENNSNLYKIKDYFALMYYVVDIEEDNSETYRNTDSLFYFFNRDTSYFAIRGCEESHVDFQYFRYPAIISDSDYLYHVHRTVNCISKSNEKSTIINKPIESTKNNYLNISNEDQYQISKLKKYRFSSDYNREILNYENYIFLIKEIPSKIYLEDDIINYNHILQIRKFDKQLNDIGNYYIKDNSMSYSFIKKGQLLIFSFTKQKYYIYEM